MIVAVAIVATIVVLLGTIAMIVRRSSMITTPVAILVTATVSIMITVLISAAIAVAIAIFLVVSAAAPRKDWWNGNNRGCHRQNCCPNELLAHTLHVLISFV